MFYHQKCLSNGENIRASSDAIAVSLDSPAIGDYNNSETVRGVSKMTRSNSTKMNKTILIKGFYCIC